MADVEAVKAPQVEAPVEGQTKEIEEPAPALDADETPSGQWIHQIFFI